MSLALPRGDAVVSSGGCVVAVVGTSADVRLPAEPEACDLGFVPFRERLAIAAASAGVDYLMFPALIESDVVVTNSAGIFDDAMAEYALALVSAVCADLPATIRLQGRREWLHRETRRLAGSEVLVLGAGGIG